MADMMSTLKSILGDDADGKIQNAMNILKNNGLMEQSNSNETDLAKKIDEQISTEPAKAVGNTKSPLSDESLEFVNQIRGLVSRMSNTNDTRSNLLRSLRPFMRTERQQAIDKAIHIINIGRFAGLLGRK